jgi:hypothetical protein
MTIELNALNLLSDDDFSYLNTILRCVLQLLYLLDS